MTVSSARAACGNGVLEAGEACDDGSSNGTANSCCDDSCQLNGDFPDVIVGDLTTPTRWGTVGGISAYSVGTVSCNVGTCWLNWIGSSAEHPVIGQNVFRLKDGRFEQIGQSWLKHGFTALAGNVCSASCDVPPNGNHLGVNCSDPYDSGLNGSQTRLGPKAAVDPYTGVFPYPDSRITTLPPDATVITKRLQIHDVDIDPALNPGALYFAEGQYVTHDDATAKKNTNNASYRPATFTGTSPFTMNLTGTTVQQKAGVQAWKATDPTVTETIVPGPEGMFIVAAKATDLGGGQWHYEYAIQNVTNHRSAQSFVVPVEPGATITNIGFHDVDYDHEAFDGTDWTATVSSNAITWATDTFATNPNANALRWGTLYNFRFDANVGPGTANATINLFTSGLQNFALVSTVVPNPCGLAPNGTFCNDFNPCTQVDRCLANVCTGTQPVQCTAIDQCHTAGTCSVGTGLCSTPAKPDGTTCDDANACTTGDACSGGVCSGTGPSLPDDVGDTVTLEQAGGMTTISWTAAPASSASSVLRGLISDLPVGPGGGGELCLASGIAATSAFDAEDPAIGDGFWYVVRGVSACGVGPYGDGRQSTTCP